MDEIRILDPNKLKEARGQRTLKEVVDASGRKFSFQQLSAWEAGHYKPRNEVLPFLVKALGVKWSDISTPIDEAHVAELKSAA